MPKSTTIIAFERPRVAAVLLPRQRTPALHTLTSDSPTILRFIERLRRQGPVRCCYEAGPVWFRATAARDLLRCREDIRVDLSHARHRLSKFLLRHGRRFTATKRAWTKRHAEWLQAQRWPLQALELTHRAYVRAVDEGVRRLQAVETGAGCSSTAGRCRS